MSLEFGTTLWTRQSDVYVLDLAVVTDVRTGTRKALKREETLRARVATDTRAILFSWGQKGGERGGGRCKGSSERDACTKLGANASERAVTRTQRNGSNAQLAAEGEQNGCNVLKVRIMGRAEQPGCGCGQDRKTERLLAFGRARRGRGW